MVNRPAAFADDMWYAADASNLRRLVEHWLSAGRPSGAKAAVCPHAGHRYSGPLAGKAVAALKSAKRVLVVGPNHRRADVPGGAWTTGTAGWTTPLGVTPVDRAGVARLEAAGVSVATERQETGEHSLEVLLPFIQVKFGTNTPIIPVNIASYPSARLIEVLRELLSDEDTVAVISSDFSHFGMRFGYAPERRRGESWRDAVSRVDHECAQAVVDCNAQEFAEAIDRTGNTVCGQLAILAVLSTNLLVRGELLDYSMSSEIPEPQEGSVSYCAIALYNN